MSHLFYTDDVVVYLQEDNSDVVCRSTAVQTPGNGFNKFIRLYVKCKGMEIFRSEKFLYGIIAPIILVAIRVPVEVFRNNSSLTQVLVLSGG